MRAHVPVGQWHYEIKNDWIRVPINDTSRPHPHSHIPRCNAALHHLNNVKRHLLLNPSHLITDIPDQQRPRNLVVILNVMLILR